MANNSAVFGACVECDAVYNRKCVHQNKIVINALLAIGRAMRYYLFIAANYMFNGIMDLRHRYQLLNKGNSRQRPPIHT